MGSSFVFILVFVLAIVTGAVLAWPVYELLSVLFDPAYRRVITYTTLATGVVISILYLSWYTRPDRNSLDRFLAELLNFINPQYYKATATLELVPAWLRFLESRRLIDPEQREQTLSELRGLDTEFLKAVKNHSDPALRRAMENWRRPGGQT